MRGCLSAGRHKVFVGDEYCAERADLSKQNSLRGSARRPFPGLSGTAWAPLTPSADECQAESNGAESRLKFPSLGSQSDPHFPPRLKFSRRCGSAGAPVDHKVRRPRLEKRATGVACPHLQSSRFFQGNFTGMSPLPRRKSLYSSHVPILRNSLLHGKPGCAPGFPISWNVVRARERCCASCAFPPVARNVVKPS